ncbi:MAG: DUF1467 family protein [Pikeienuella sp.]|uniref:DUF1467 family protein n=1 Tax=Pikeienuella sp. TaxID=2831957 RepID=UPI00391AF32F
MSLTNGIVLYAVLWFVALYLILPLFVRSQEEAGEVEPGTPAGAPDQPLMKKKLIWTTIAAAVAWVAAFAFIESEILTVADIATVFSRPQ